MIGLRLNNYEIVSILGEGGMGTVYLARHTYMGRLAAIKLLRPEMLRDESVVVRFLDEARATNAIHHPNIIDIIDVGMLSDGRTPYLMMEFLDGESLNARLERSRPLPIHEAVEITCQTASALAAAHARGIVHRDLKPDNLYLVPDETMAAKVRVKVLDFGIAKLRGDIRGGAVRTQTGAIMGTPQYMSPEQCRGLSAAIDHRTDIYALGIILYEMLCGQVPFISEGLGEIMLRHMTELPAPLRARVPELPEPLERAVLRALAKKPDERFESMTDFARAVREYDPRAALTAQAMGWRDAHAETPALGATLLARSVTPPPVLMPPVTPVQVASGATPRPEAVFASTSLPPLRSPIPATIAPSVVEPTWIPGQSSGGAHTTLSAHTGQIATATDRISLRQGRRGLMIGVVAGGLAVIGVLAGLMLRSPAPARRPAPAAARAQASVAAPAVASPSAPVPSAATAPAVVAAPVAKSPVPKVASPDEPARVRGKKSAKREARMTAAQSVHGEAPGTPQPLLPPTPAALSAPSTGPKGGSRW